MLLFNPSGKIHICNYGMAQTCGHVWFENENGFPQNLLIVYKFYFLFNLWNIVTYNLNQFNMIIIEKRKLTML